MKLNSKKECSNRSKTLPSALPMKLPVGSQRQSRQVTCTQQNLHKLRWTTETISWMKPWSSSLMSEHAKRSYKPSWWKHTVHLDKWQWSSVIQMRSQLDLLLLSGYTGKEVEFSTVLPQGLATLPLRAWFVDPVNEM